MNFDCFNLTLVSSIFYAKSHLAYSGILKFLNVCFWWFVLFCPPPPLFFLLATVCQLASSSYLISSLLKDVCQIIPGTALPLNIIATFITLQVPINFQNM